MTCERVKSLILVPAQVPGDGRPGLGELVLDLDLDRVLGLAAAEVELLALPRRVHSVPPDVSASVHRSGDSDLAELKVFLEFKIYLFCFL